MNIEREKCKGTKMMKRRESREKREREKEASHLAHLCVCGPKEGRLGYEDWGGGKLPSPRPIRSWEAVGVAHGTGTAPGCGPGCCAWSLMAKASLREKA